MAGGVFLSLPAYPQGALKQELTPNTTTPEAGSVVNLAATVQNTGNAPLTGQFFITVSIDSGTFLSVTSQNPAITFSKQPDSSGETYRGSASNVTIAQDDRLFFNYQFLVPKGAAQGSRVRFQSTVTGFGGQSSISLLSFTITGVAEGGPQLSITINRAHKPQAFAEDALEYDLDIVNIGNADTTGPIHVVVTLAVPFQITTNHVNTISWNLEGAGVYSQDQAKTLEPGEKYNTGELELGFHPVRGDYVLTAVATGGGSSRVEKTDVFSFDGRYSVPVTEPGPVSIDGRARP